MKIWEKETWIKIGKEHTGILLFSLGMAIYYGWRMFALDPWYDELYTYYSFLSKGPVYAAIHWPVPNNHVMYSVLSAFFNIFGNRVKRNNVQKAHGAGHIKCTRPLQPYKHETKKKHK